MVFPVDHMQVDINTLQTISAMFRILVEQKMICTWGEYIHPTSLEGDCGIWMGFYIKQKGKEEWIVLKKY